MEQQPRIGRATESDIQAILALWRSEGVPSSRTADAEALRAAIAYPTSAVFVARVEGTVVGSVIAAWDGWRGRCIDWPSRRNIDGKDWAPRSSNEASTT
jgi:hypothetical protein